MSPLPEVRLVAATVPLLESLTADPARFSEMIGSPIPEGWPEFPEAIPFALEFLQHASDSDRPWSMQFFVESSTGVVVGSGGFAAPPHDRTVEIGYEIAPGFRGRGWGAASARALVDRAVESGEVDAVVANTLAGPNASTGVLLSIGFEHVGEQEDPEAGVTWQWRWDRPPTSG
ncbi:MAG TPA: GNAT family protein [Nocardioides sp.]|nr:GNAT family protein [Nocardioides sp.]